MKEFKGTPGPWFVDNNSHFIEIRSIDGQIGDTCSSGFWFDDDYCFGEKTVANSNLIAAAPDFLQAALMGQTMQTKEFLHWIADRLVFVHGENENVDFIISLRERADAIGKAVEKALGE